MAPIRSEGAFEGQHAGRHCDQECTRSTRDDPFLSRHRDSILVHHEFCEIHILGPLPEYFQNLSRIHESLVDCACLHSNRVPDDLYVHILGLRIAPKRI